ncbi:pentatricopeptide repeat (PPR-like) superfamily protein [Actinidia rufa]|uniref:Pentatricopeptide repeat (PPR-like) superfamily protein n=1 Tax=Actinidia rufa TaxID=165716 RepID=A0A7J0G489_9ERIC|nr:pentatricopeptide repeat (PPR-like) superfamily protein [Actinidia rufa]
MEFKFTLNSFSSNPDLKRIGSLGTMCSTLLQIGSGFFRDQEAKWVLDFGVEPNGFTLSAVIKACSELGDVNIGRCFDGVVFRRGFDLNYVIVSALTDMYGRNCESGDARQVFDELLEPDAICWTSVISASRGTIRLRKRWGYFIRCRGITGCRRMSLRLGWEFGEAKTWELDKVELCSFGTVLQVCARLAAVRQGKEVHCQYLRRGGWRDVIVESALVDLHTGLVDRRGEHFTSLTKQYRIKAGIEHYNCMVDLLGRSGQIEETEY